MTDEEKQEFLKILKKEQEKLSNNSKKAKEFLVKIGVSTQGGNLKRDFKDLCIPQEQV